MKTFAKNRVLYYFAVAICLLEAAVFLSACSGNEYDGAGAAEIRLTLKETYENAEVSCPGGEISNSGNVYSIKVASRKMTDVIVSCEGYFTETVTVYTKDFISGVAEKTVELRKRVNTLTLSVSGVADITTVNVKSQNDRISSSTVNGKKLVIEFKDFSSVPDNEIDVLSVESNGYRTNSIAVNKSYFIDYSASLSITLLSETSASSAVTFINDVDSEQYGFSVYRAIGNQNYSGTSISVKSSTTRLLDRGGNYYITVYGERMSYTPMRIGADEYYKTVKLSDIKGIEDAKNRNNYSGMTVSILFNGVSREERGMLNLYDAATGTRIDYFQKDEYNYECYAKNGDEIKVVGEYNGILYAAYTATVENGTLTVEKKIDEGTKAKIRFVDVYGKPLTVADAKAKGYTIELLNYYSGEKYLVENGDDFIDITDTRVDIAEKKSGSMTEKGQTTNIDFIEIDINKLMVLKARDNTPYMEKDGDKIRSAHDDMYECIYFSQLLKKEYCEITVAETLDFKIRFVKYNADPAAPKQYITNIDVEYAYRLKKAPGDDFYTYKATEGELAAFGVLYSDDEDPNAKTYYADTGFMPFAEFYEKDGSYYVAEIPLYETRTLLVTFVGFSPQENGSSIRMNFGNVNFYIDTKSGVSEVMIDERYVGGKYTVEYYDYMNQTAYSGEGTLTEEDFDNRHIELRLTRMY